MPFLQFSEDWLTQWKSCKILRNCTKYRKSSPEQTHQKSTCFQYFTNKFRGFLTDTNYVDTHCRSFIVNSQMAVEHLAKTMLKRHKVSPKNTHNMTRLTMQMHAQRPDDVAEGDWTALTVRIESLNGDSCLDHQAGYQKIPLTAEKIRHATTRLSQTFLLPVDEAESALHPHDVPATMGLSVACLGDAFHQASLAKEGRTIHANIQSLQSHATHVGTLDDTPKIAKCPPNPAAKSFLIQLRPLEAVISFPITKRVAALESTEDQDSHNPFEVDISTTKPSSPFDP